MVHPTVRELAQRLVIGALTDGGATLTLSGRKAKGFMVGGAAIALRRMHDAPIGKLVDDVEAWLDRLLDSAGRFTAIGSWLDDNTGAVYFDAVTVEFDSRAAAELAGIRGELAFGHIADDGTYTEFTRDDAGNYWPAD